MKAHDPLRKLLEAAARAERQSKAELPAMPPWLPARVLAARATPAPDFSFFPLLRAALACAALVAVICAGIHFQTEEKPDAFEYSLNYSLATAYMK